VLALDKKTFGVLLSGNTEVATRLVEQLVRRLRHAEEQLENAMLRDQPSRVVIPAAPGRLGRDQQRGTRLHHLALELSAASGSTSTQ